MPKSKSDKFKPKPVPAAARRSWSLSALLLWEECPRRRYYKVVERVPEPDEGKSPALLRGIEVHEAAHAYLLDDRGAVPKPLRLFAKEFRELRRVGATPEGNWAFDRWWAPTDYWGDAAWLRGKADVHWVEDVAGRNVLRIVDVKTGRPRPYDDQHRLYVAMGFCHAASLAHELEISRVSFQLWYVDQGLPVPKEPKLETPGAAAGYQNEFARRAARMFADREFRARPSPSTCKWCPYSKRKGGPCAEGK